MKKPSEIEVELMGGLGNQLFQYFAGLKIASDLGLSLKLSSRNQWVHKSNHANSDIWDFKLIANEDIKKSSRTMFTKLVWRVNFILLRKSGLYGSILYRLGVVTDKTIDSNIRKTNFFCRKLRLKGYFQNPKWFQELNPQARAVSLINESNWFKIEKSRITNPNVVVVHLRFGDYLNSRSGMSVLDVSYYLDSLKQISLGNIISEVVVFSDDISAAKELFKDEETPEIRYLIPPSEAKASESLLLMAEAHTLVIANSTFSLWAGLLGNPNKSVYFPSRWFVDESGATLSFPNNWNEVTVKDTD